MKRSQGTIVIDGSPDEEDWSLAQKAGDFKQVFPEDSVPAIDQTEIMITFDDKNLYVAGRCYESSDKDHIVSSLRRDFDWPRNENFSIYIDPFNDFTNGFTFGITPFGVQREGVITNGVQVGSDWDNKWFSEVQQFEGGWSFEMAIPFKTLRYDEDNKLWNIVFLRNNLKTNERTVWATVPQGLRSSSFAFAGRLIFEDSLKKAGTNVAFIPYISGGGTRDYEEGTSPENTSNIGFDAKIGVSSSLNLDLTFNPDFSQVEVDQQVTNLSRFEIRFPERRQFFLENQDLFGQNGFPSSRPFFSRRIGIATDTAGNSKQIPITYGARLSGKVGQNWRIGLLNMRTKEENDAVLTGLRDPETDEESELEPFRLLPQNYTVAVVQRQLGRSNIGATFVNRQTLNFDPNDSTLTTSRYNRVFGLDYNLLSADNRWNGNFFYHRSFDPDQRDDAFASGIFLQYRVTEFELGMSSNTIGEGYNAELGFVRRRDITNNAIFGQYRFYPKSGPINNHGPGGRLRRVMDLDFNRTDASRSARYQASFNNTARIEFEYEYNYQLLRNSFGPTDGEELPEGTDYDWHTYSIEFGTDRRKLLSFNGNVTIGGFYNGQRQNYGGRINFRAQPYANFVLLVDYNNITLPDPFGDANFWLVGPRVDLTFTDKVFLTTFMQYNEQADNINLNVRFQWRFKPVSDLFVVYTDNYLPSNLEVRNRALVFKLTYWLNF
ncbi:MAG: DUF5916 domain-containing protein [Bacteroidota bacterium]